MSKQQPLPTGGEPDSPISDRTSRCLEEENDESVESDAQNGTSTQSQYWYFSVDAFDAINRVFCITITMVRTLTYVKIHFLWCVICFVFDWC